MTRILLFSDLALDRPYPWASPAIAESRRRTARAVLDEVISAARDHEVDVIACAGNLYDRRTVRPATIRGAQAVLESCGLPVLITPGPLDFTGPDDEWYRGWPANVTVFESERFTPVEVEDGIVIWGAAHTVPTGHEPLVGAADLGLDPDTVNLALFHQVGGTGTSDGGLPAQTPVRDADIGATGFSHALVGAGGLAHLGRNHTSPGEPLAHGFDLAGPRGAVLVKVADDGTVEGSLVELPSPRLSDTEIDLTGATSPAEVLDRVKDAIECCHGTTRLRAVGLVPPDAAIGANDLTAIAAGESDVIVDWRVEIDVGDLAEEASVRGQFVRDVLADASLVGDRRRRVLLTGLRALSASGGLEAVK